MPKFDVIVIGCGAVGSAALLHLAKAGRRVLGIDRFQPPHQFGSTHGETRITRAAIGEGVDYTPLAQRSHVLWRELERETCARLFEQCGCLFIPSQHGGEVHGVTSAQFFANIESAARLHGVDGETLSSERLRADYPAFAMTPGDRAFLDREGGYLLVEDCVRTELAVAARLGAEILTGRRVTAFRRAAGELTVTMDDGATASGTTLIVTTGPWITELIAPLRRRVNVTRQVLYWFEVLSHPQRFGPNTPVFIWDVSGRERAASDIYGFPWLGSPDHGVKIANEMLTSETDPDHVAREVTAEEIAATYETYVRPFVPDLGPRCLRSAVCLYTNAPGGRFIIDRDPGDANVIYASPCSGHGFKHSPAVGEALAAMALGQPPRVDISGFTLDRLALV
ncbi:putative Monomeric sarcosine oxidase (MSOX) [Bradyrhizobium sp. ORS 285]|uniref:N-methyl-L-tryptophan oxidase n=1 Tax=Bradyrhizobium sp. ORS 285 TaxID=115808 RepID=UPI0002406D26|nr:N-methyl-L-tryptophan oxidase [Bradyrhizobium sp. ORS 285]CCD86094.1 putative Monomeric sarcosine oxidase (MSOX) [Bradyrhizobium sp. ORS 285]SMX59910.1 putative Monomeric sarcosine oxidase (MSOX) [Bradyrhizobium sp. ORS 285]